MLRKYAILFGISSSLLLLLIATLHYPGGSQHDKNAIGFDWKNNYLTNLFAEKAVNGSANEARLWAIIGMFFLCVSLALFFIKFSKKIPQKGAANIIRYCGVGAMPFAFLAVTPYHDIMIIIAITPALISIFYCTVFIVKSKLYLATTLSIVYLLFFYSSNFIYYTNTYVEFLPIFQKATLALTIIWTLSLEYFTKREDFQDIKAAQSTEVTNR